MWGSFIFKFANLRRFIFVPRMVIIHQPARYMKSTGGLWNHGVNLTPFLKCPPKKTSLKTGSTKTTNFQPLLKKTLMCSNSHHSLTISNPPLCQKRGYVFISTSEKRKETFIYNINHLCGFPINLSINQSINQSIIHSIKSNQIKIKSKSIHSPILTTMKPMSCSTQGHQWKLCTGT